MSDTFSPALPAADQEAISALLGDLYAAWNRLDADGMAHAFTEDGTTVGFDGSQMTGRAQIASELKELFADHVMPPYIWKVKNIRALAPDVALLSAVVGMIPPGETDVNPALNAIVTLTAVRTPDGWRAAHLHNTPAQFHGRPELAAAVTAEIQAARQP